MFSCDMNDGMRFLPAFTKMVESMRAVPEGGAEALPSIDSGDSDW